MRIKSSIGLAVGPVDGTHWGQVLVTPTAYGIIEILDPQEQAQQRGVQILSLLSELLSRDVSSLQVVEEIADKILNSVVQSLVLFVPVGRVAYVVLRGRAGVFVKRRNELASLMHDDGGVSGEIREGDTFLLVSHGFSQVLSHDELTTLFDHLPPSEVAEKLTLLLHEKKGGEGSVALVYEASELQEDQLREEVVVEEKKESPLLQEKSTIEPVQNNLKQWTKHVAGVISLPRVKRYITTLRQNPKRMKAAFVIFLTSLFAISVVLGVWKQATAKKNQQIMSALSDAQHALDEGVALSPLDSVKSRERLTYAKQLLDPYIHTISTQTTEGYEMQTLYRKITDNLTQSMQIIKISPALFYDMSLVKKGATATSMDLDGNTLAIGDQLTSTVYQIDITSKNAQVIGGGANVKQIESVAIHGDSTYALTSDGVIGFSETTGSSKRVVTKDDSWGVVTTLVSFGGNLYILDTEKGRIWKYVATDSGFSTINEYLNSDTLPDLSRATGMSIDGSVWIGTTDGKILRFTQGRDNPYVSHGVTPAFGLDLRVYTSDSVNNVYVLDNQNNRVVVLDKDGTYLAQYQWSQKFNPSALTVSEQAKKIFLLAGGKIYSIDLK